MRFKIIAIYLNKIDRPPSNKIILDNLTFCWEGSNWKYSIIITTDITDRFITKLPSWEKIIK